VRINLMIEGQEDVTWGQWTDLARTAEEVGLEGLFRSDHYQSVQGRADRGSLDAWTTLAGLGALTSRIRLGTMVSPTSFRHPSVLAKAVVTADHISGGRVELGIGAGWLEQEHASYGFAFHDVGRRFDVLAEQLEIINRQFTEDSFDFRGEHYTLEDSRALPKPVQQPRVPVVVGGSGGPRSARLAARWADEYNTVFPTPDDVRERKSAVERACEEAGREPLRFSVMTGCLIGDDEAEFRDRVSRLMELSGADKDFDTYVEGLSGSWVTGTVEQAAERLEEYAAAGAERIMLQHQLHDDLDMVGLIGRL
jgi:F420-dependent oxidoreductase-like protein